MTLPQKVRIRQGHRGWTLTELLVAVGISSIVMMAVAGFTIYSLRSFVALSNYADLDERSRRTVDDMTRQIRQATGVVSFQATGTNRWLTLTNTIAGASNRFVRYAWSSQTRVLSFASTTQPQIATLTECDNWEFSLHMRSPIPGTTNMFYPATNSSGAIDLSVVKLVDMKWRCSRQVLGNALQTESVQTTKIVLRNH